MGVKNMIKKAAAKAGDAVAKVSVLSPEQVENIQLARENYLLEEPDPTDDVARVRTERMMAASSIEIFNAFLPQLKELYLPVDKNAEYEMPFDTDHNIRYINITKWVTDKKENNLEKLVNVYAVLADEDCNIALIFNRTKENTNVYLAIVNTKNADNNHDADEYKRRIIEAIRGNFPGAEWKEEGFGVLPCLAEDSEYSVASASNIPTEKSEKFISQTIEKLLDGVVPDTKKKEYTVILLATPIQDVEERKLKLGEFYSGLTPYASWSTNFTYTDSNSIASTATVGVNVGASAGVQNTNSYSNTATDSNTENSSVSNTESNSVTDTEGTSVGESSSSAHTDGTNSASTDTHGSSDSVGGSAGVNAGVQANVNYNHGWNRSKSETLGKMASDTITKGVTNTVSKSVAKLISEWEQANGRDWPRYKEDVYVQSKATGEMIKLREAGQRYDAHHIQPLSMGGKNEASNLTPLRADVHEDHRGVHTKEGVYGRIEQTVGGN